MNKRRLWKLLVNMQQVALMQAHAVFEAQNENGKLKHIIHKLTHEAQDQTEALEQYHAKYGPLKPPDPKEVS